MTKPTITDKELQKRKDFESHIEEIQTYINRRKAGWKIPLIEWEDVSQILMIRIWNKFHLFSAEKGPFENWANRLISNALTNLIRDNFSKYSRPCIAGCVYNTGSNDCSFTASGKQCSECPLYKRWTRKKQQQFNVATSVSLEDHYNETNNIICDSANIETSKHIIDDRLKEVLSEREWKVYTLLFIENKSMEDVGKIMHFKLLPSSNIPGYQELLRYKRRFIEVSREIILDEGLI